MNHMRWTLLIAFLIGMDQLTKWWVETSLPLYQQIEVIPFLSLFRTYNEGVAFSALSGLGPYPLIVVAIVIILFVLWLWRNIEPGRLISEFGFALVLAGAFGNLIDRVRLGKVIDMIFFHIDSVGFQFAIFNVADTFITLGAAAIIYDEFRLWRKSRKIGSEPGK